MNARRGDLWTDAMRALGLQASGARSPFRDLETREDAVEMVHESATALLLVGLVQIALSWAAGVGSAVDALAYMPLALLLHRFQSRLAAALLLLFSLGSVAVTVAAFVMGIEARTDLVLIAVLLWASVRALEATGKLAAETPLPGTDRPPIVLRSRDAVNGGGHHHRRVSSSTGWLALALVALAIAAAPRFLPSSVSQGVVAPKAATQPRPAAPARERIAPPADDGQLVLPPPTGLIEPRATEPGIGTMAEAFVQPAMKLAALFVSPSDLESFRRDHQFAPTRYVMIQTVRDPRAERIAPEAYAAAKGAPAATRAQRLARLIGADAALSQWLHAVAEPAGTVADLDGAKVTSEGALAETDRVISFGAVVEVGTAGAKRPTQRVVITSLVLAQGAVLVVYTHGTYAKPEDVDAAADVAREVARNVVHANPA